MKFGEKISNVLKTNDKEIRSLGDLERFVGLGLHTIRKAIDTGREPLQGTQMKIVEKMGISLGWWESGEGNIYRENLTPVMGILAPGRRTIEDLEVLIDYYKGEAGKYKDKAKSLQQQLDDCKSSKGVK